MRKSREYENRLVADLADFQRGVTVADFCEATGHLVQTVSTTMTRLGRDGRARWEGKRRSASTGALGKVWFACQL